MKHILLTGGPTNEYVDEVMKITNMSTGSLTLSLAKTALEKGDKVTIIVTNSILLTKAFASIEGNPNLKVVPIETTQDMYDALEAEGKDQYDVIIHASAVGDYKPEFTFRMEDMAKEIAQGIFAENELSEEEMEAKILKIMSEGKCRVNDDTKISSYEPNLTIKLTLTTKLISNLRRWFPNAKLIGCKLLENVEKEHLIDVATKLAIKNDMDYIMANDLAMIRNGQPIRFLCTKEGYTGIELNGNGPALLDYARDEWF